MFTRRTINIFLVLAFLLSACTLQAAPTSTPLPATKIPSSPTILPPTQTKPPTVVPPIHTPSPTTVPPTPTTPPTAIPPTHTPAPTAVPPTNTVEPTAAPTEGSSGLPDISAANYLDDRSTPAAVMLSYFNAINRHEYLRAYSYYADPSALGTLDHFSSGYSDTQSVKVVFGPINDGAAAGSIYYTVPIVLKATTTTGTKQKFAACYLLRFPQPANYGAPPITPMNIDRSTAKSVPLTTQDSAALASACPSPDFPTGPNSSPAAVESLTDLSAANYIDNRSNAVALMSSFINALNRKEYVRAFSYWETPPGSYDAFAAGYTTTASVAAQFGAVTTDHGAGQIYYSLPLALKATQTDSSLKTYVGCYVLHLSQPGIQGVPPFQPLGIKSADIKKVANDADLNALLATACP